jgi:hypothetical protein
MSLAYGIIYLTFTMYPLAFVTVRGWSRLEGSLPFVGMTIGVALACIGIALHSIYYIQRRRVHVPERRLPPMIAGSILLSAGTHTKLPCLRPPSYIFQAYSGSVGPLAHQSIGWHKLLLGSSSAAAPSWS